MTAKPKYPPPPSDRLAAARGIGWGIVGGLCLWASGVCAGAWLWGTLT